MRSIKVTWSEEDLKCQMTSMGYEPTKANIKKVKENMLAKSMINAMTQAGWEMMSDVITIAMED